MSSSRERAWVFGPAPDLLLGCGMLYVLLIPVLWFGGAGFEGATRTTLLPWLIILFSGSHYGATLLRVYEDERERRAYKIFTVWATVLVVGALLGSLHYPIAGSVLITVYLTWSPWHYTGQNYGISVMMLRRRGVDVTPMAKRWLYTSFVLSFVLVFLNFHFEGGIVQYDPLGYSSASEGFRVLSLGLPGIVRTVMLPTVGVAYLASLVVAGVLLLRGGSVRAVAPTAALALTQAIWFAIPHAAFYLDLVSPQSFQFYFLWAALGHALQYLWITSYFARSDPRWRGFGVYFAKVFAFGNAVWAAPVLFFGPGMLGSPDYENGLAICVAAAVNIHHFILDGAIWKLRNPKIAGILIRSQPEAPATAEPIGQPSWGRRFAWAYAALFSAGMVIPMIEISERLPRAFERGDHRTAEKILDRAAYYGRDSGYRRAQLANELIKERNPVAAARQFWRSLALTPQADGFVQLGVLYEMHDRDDMALMTWKTGLEQFPENFELLRRVGEKLLATNAPQEALPYLRRAAAARPGDEGIQSALERAREGLSPDHAGGRAIPPSAS